MSESSTCVPRNCGFGAYQQISLCGSSGRCSTRSAKLAGITEVFNVVVTSPARRGTGAAVIRFDGTVTAIEGSLGTAGRMATLGPAEVWSHCCWWDELAVLCGGLDDMRSELDVVADWSRR